MPECSVACCLASCAGVQTVSFSLWIATKTGSSTSPRTTINSSDLTCKQLSHRFVRLWHVTAVSCGKAKQTNKALRRAFNKAPQDTDSRQESSHFEVGFRSCQFISADSQARPAIVLHWDGTSHRLQDAGNKWSRRPTLFFALREGANRLSTWR